MHIHYRCYLSGSLRFLSVKMGVFLTLLLAFGTLFLLWVALTTLDMREDVGHWAMHRQADPQLN